MFTKNFFFKNLKKKKNNRNLREYLNLLIISKTEVIKSLTDEYEYSFLKQKLKKF